MADHFEEVVNLRISAVEQRLDSHDSEALAMQQALNGGFAAMILGFLQMTDRFERLEQRMDRLEQRMDRLDQRIGVLETRMDAVETKLDGVLEIVQDIARRL